MLIFQRKNWCFPRELYYTDYDTNPFNGGEIEGGTWFKHTADSTFTDYFAGPPASWEFRHTCNYETEVRFERLDISPNWYNDINFGLFALTCHPVPHGTFVGYKVLNGSNPADWDQFPLANVADFSANVWRFVYRADLTWELFRNDISQGSGSVGSHFYPNKQIVNHAHSLVHNAGHRVDYYRMRTID